MFDKHRHVCKSKLRLTITPHRRVLSKRVELWRGGDVEPDFSENINRYANKTVRSLSYFDNHLHATCLPSVKLRLFLQT